MKTVTLKDVIGFGPCWLTEPNGRERVEEALAGRKQWSALDCINDLPGRGVSAKDILWLILREALIDATTLHSLACDFAQVAVDRYWKPKYPNDARPQNAIDTKRRWIRGEATQAEVKVAASAAYSAAVSAACDEQLALVKSVLAEQEST
jgi:hypothetical protein